MSVAETLSVFPEEIEFLDVRLNQTYIQTALDMESFKTVTRCLTAVLAQRAQQGGINLV